MTSRAHGDRHFGDDKAIVGGVARPNGRPAMVIGQKRAEVKDKVHCILAC